MVKTKLEKPIHFSKEPFSSRERSKLDKLVPEKLHEYLCLLSDVNEMIQDHGSKKLRNYPNMHNRVYKTVYDLNTKSVQKLIDEVRRLYPSRSFEEIYIDSLHTDGGDIDFNVDITDEEYNTQAEIYNKYVAEYNEKTSRLSRLYRELCQLI